MRGREVRTPKKGVDSHATLDVPWTKGGVHLRFGQIWGCFAVAQGLWKLDTTQKNSRRLWRSGGRRESSSVPEGAANFPAAGVLAGKCPNLGRDGISCCWKIGE